MKKQWKAALVAGLFGGQCLIGPGLIAHAAPPAGVASIDGQTHNVVRGDTLWDLTAHYLNNPWYWPKVWSYNPQLTNPHYIYPGQVIRFFPGGAEESPTRFEVSSRRDMPQDATSEPADAPDEPVPPPSKLTLTDDKPRAAAVAVFGNRPIAFRPTRGMIVQSVQLATAKELQEAGTLKSSFEDKALLSTYDIIFVKFRDGVERPHPGQPLVIYKMMEELQHPIDGSDYGYLTQITGTAEVIEASAEEDLVSARINKTYEPIERGQMVALQKAPLVSELIETASTTKVKGVVLKGEYHSDTLLGQYSYIFIDKGTKDGVANGNRFAVVRNRDLYNPTANFGNINDGDPVPAQVIGKVVVIDAKDNASLALVTQSLRDFLPGDPVEIR